MAIVDLKTGQIYGAKEGTKTYYHELGHIEFSKNYLGQRISYYQSFFMMTAVFFISLGLMTSNKYIISFGFVNSLGMILSYLYEEVWCWIWGLRAYYNRTVK